MNQVSHVAGYAANDFNDFNDFSDFVITSVITAITAIIVIIVITEIAGDLFDAHFEGDTVDHKQVNAWPEMCVGHSETPLGAI